MHAALFLSVRLKSELKKLQHKVFTILALCYLKLTTADLHFNTPSVPRLWEANAPSLRRQRHYVSMLLELFNNSAKRTTTKAYLMKASTTRDQIVGTCKYYLCSMNRNRECKRTQLRIEDRASVLKRHIANSNYMARSDT